jgi:phosphatidylglycerol:prolipoprotein diacylglycerol transferase
MHPVFFDLHIFGRPVYWYGVMVALGYLAVMFFWSWLARREKLAAGFSSSLATWLIVAGILGARLAYILANWHEYAANPLDILRIDRGGLVYYGGLIGGVAGFFLFARVKKLPVFALGDFAVCGLPLGHALGRVGCFMNGCCYGSPCSLSWAVPMQDAMRHPVQLYEAAGNLLLFAALCALYFRKRRDGSVAAAYFLLYPLLRFTLEFWRGDLRITYFGMTLAQNTSVALFIAGLVILALRPRERRPLAAPHQQA